MGFRVAITFNLIHESMLDEGPLDAIAEFDTKETIQDLKSSLESKGHSVILIEANEDAYEQLKKHRNDIDIVFNIAEGLHGESRESQIPAFLEMLRIPYIGSGPLTLAICLDKPRTKQILNFYNIPTPKFQVFYSPDDDLSPNLNFPLIAKLSREGSAMGLSQDSVVKTKKALKNRVKYLIDTYHQPVLVEEFISGKEFTIPIIGNKNPIVLPIIEMNFAEENGINLFIPDDPIMPLLEERNIKTHDFSSCSFCPPKTITSEQEQLIKDIALKSYKALGCYDWCRMEIRMDKEGNMYVLELNPIPGIDRSYWFATSAKTAGMSYEDLVDKILRYGAERYQLKERVISRSVSKRAIKQPATSTKKIERELVNIAG